VELSDGVSGFGEATSNPYYNTSVPRMIEDLNKIRNIIETNDGDTPEDFGKIHSYLKDNLFALCALDMAYTDLCARKKAKVI
jgi:L-alanine-DL-glutamate epimerase-like enolase superfamily enzyme